MSTDQIVEGFSLSHAQILTGSESFLDALASSAAEDEDIYGVNDSSMDPDTGDYDNEGDDSILSTWSWVNFVDVAVKAGYLSLPLISNLTGRPIDSVSPIAAADEVQTMTIGGTGGTYTLTFLGQTTSALAFGAAAATIQTALEALSTVDTGDITVAGTGGTRTFTFGGDYHDEDVPAIIVDSTSLTGGVNTIATTTAGHGAQAEAYEMDLWHEDSMNTPPRPMVVAMPSKDMAGNVRRLAIGLYRVQFKPITFDGPAYKDGLKVNYNGRGVMSALDELGQPFSDGKKRVGRILSYLD